MSIIKRTAVEQQYTKKPSFTGACTLAITNVNPTNAQLKALGLYVREDSDEPSGTIEINGKTVNKITIAGKITYTLSGEQHEDSVKFDLLLEEGTWQSKTNPENYCYINQLYSLKWGKSAEAIIASEKEALEQKKITREMFGKRVRYAFKGERALMELIAKANNYSPFLTTKAEDKTIENILSLDATPFSKGWFTEIKKALEGNSVVVFVGKSLTKDDKVYFGVVTALLSDCFLSVGQAPSEWFIRKFQESLIGGKFTIQDPKLNTLAFVEETITPNNQNNQNGNSQEDCDLPF